MAVSITNIDSGNVNSADPGSITSTLTNSITPGANHLILISVMTRTAISTQPNTPTVSGCGLTWVSINSLYYDTTSTSRKKLTLFRALGSSPTTGQLTINLGGQDQTDIIWVTNEVTGIDTSGTNGSGAIVQSQTGTLANGGSQTVTLAAFSNVNNGCYGAFTNDASSGTNSPGSGFTSLVAKYFTTSSQNWIDEWKSTNDTTVDATLPSTSGAIQGAIAIEIAAASTTTHLLSSLGVGS